MLVENRLRAGIRLAAHGLLSLLVLYLFTHRTDSRFPARRKRLAMRAWPGGHFCETVKPCKATKK
jgi:hypothetical protein